MATPRAQLPQRSSTSIVDANETAKSRKGTVVIELRPSQEYIPNSGPPPGAITPAPPYDSTGYIIERIFLPPDGRGKDGEPKPRRPTYIVGWRDLVGARLLVPAMDILDYVSPWEVEQWEEEHEEQLSEERRKLEEEKQRAKQALTLPLASQPQQQPKKRGRKPKKTGIETAAVAELEPEDGDAMHLKGGAMSFTPQKPRLVDFVGLSSADGTPSRQLTDEQEEAIRAGAKSGTAEDMEHFDAVEEDMDTVKGLGDFVADFGNSQGGLGSLPPLELQHTNPYADAAPKPGHISPAVEIQSRSSKSSWVTAGTSPYKTLNPQAGDGAEAGTRKKSELSDQLPDKDELEWAAQSRLPVKSTAPRPEKQRLKSEVEGKKSKPKKRKREAEAQQPVNVEGEQQWVVKRLEDAQLYDVEGVGLVRYFKVLWEGDWPPDQNPSWEPEENLPPALVRNFDKRSKDRSTSREKHKKKVQKKTMKQTTLSWGDGKKYDSVSHAFAGDEDLDFPAPKEERPEPMDDTQDHAEVDEGADQLLVVDQDQGSGTKIGFPLSGQRNAIFG